MKEFSELKRGDTVFVICPDFVENNVDMRAREFNVKSIKVNRRKKNGDFVSIELDRDTPVHNFYHKEYLPKICQTKNEYEYGFNKYIYQYNCQDNLWIYSVIIFSCKEAFIAWIQDRIHHETQKYNSVIIALETLSRMDKIDPTAMKINTNQSTYNIE